MDRDRTGGPTSVGLYVNETRVASLRGVGDRYFPWAAARGVDALVPPFSGWVYHRCEDRGGHQCGELLPLFNGSFTALRRLAKSRGWTWSQRDDSWLCAACSPYREGSR